MTDNPGGIAESEEEGHVWAGAPDQHPSQHQHKQPIYIYLWQPGPQQHQQEHASLRGCGG